MGLNTHRVSIHICNMPEHLLTPVNVRKTFNMRVKFQNNEQITMNKSL